MYRLSGIGPTPQILDPQGNAISLEELIRRVNDWLVPDSFIPTDEEDGEVYSDPSELYIDDSFSDVKEDFVQEFDCTRSLGKRYYAYRWNEEEDMHEVVGYAETAEEAWEIL